MTSHRNAVRKEQARQELVRLRCDIGEWLKLRRASDETGQYATQLDALEEMLAQGRAAAESELEAVDDAAAPGDVYAACRKAEERATFLRRYWLYFRTKWDQRDDRVVGPVVRSADEAIWSCWAPVFFAAGREAPAPAPLPYVEPFFVPRAITRTDPPYDLRPDSALADALKRLPVPIVGLPPVCVARPWWLIFLAHETGHHVQHDLGVLRAFRDVIAGVPLTGPAAWVDWHEELFADAISVLLTGNAAAWAMDELLFGPPDELLAENRSYPPPVVRAAFMVALLEEAGLQPAAGVPAAAPPAPAPEGPDAARARALLEDVPAVAKAVATAHLDGAGTLPSLCGFEPAPLLASGEVAFWSREFAKGNEPPASLAPEAARRALAGAVGAWEDVAREEDGARRADRAEKLRKAVVATLPKLRPPGRRATPAAVDTAGAAASLLGVLLGERPLTTREG